MCSFAFVVLWALCRWSDLVALICYGLLRCRFVCFGFCIDGLCFRVPWYTRCCGMVKLGLVLDCLLVLLFCGCCLFVFAFLVCFAGDCVEIVLPRLGWICCTLFWGI